MSRISIDVTPEEHQRLKALAALQGKSIKEFVLASTLGAQDESADLTELEALLDRRIAHAKTKGVSNRTIEDIFRRARKQIQRGSDA